MKIMATAAGAHAPRQAVLGLTAPLRSLGYCIPLVLAVDRLGYHMWQNEEFQTKWFKEASSQAGCPLLPSQSMQQI